MYTYLYIYIYICLYIYIDILHVLSVSMVDFSPWSDVLQQVVLPKTRGESVWRIHHSKPSRGCSRGELAPNLATFGRGSESLLFLGLSRERMSFCSAKCCPMMARTEEITFCCWEDFSRDLGRIPRVFFSFFLGLLLMKPFPIG